MITQHRLYVDDIKCPNCSRVLDGATAVDTDHAPQEGDISICFYCHNLSIYQGNGKDLHLAPVTEELKNKLPQDVLDNITELITKIKR